MKRSVKTKQSLASLRFLLQRAINLGGGAVVKSFHIFFYLSIIKYRHSKDHKINVELREFL